jgi:hypothetical protein
VDLDPRCFDSALEKSRDRNAARVGESSTIAL